MQKALVPFILCILCIDVNYEKISIPGRRASIPPPHQPSPVGDSPSRGGVIGPGSAGVPPAYCPCQCFRPRQRLRARVQTGNILYTIKPGTWLTPCHSVGQGALCRPQDHSPLEGESARPGRRPRSSRWGGAFPRLVSYRDYLHRWTGHTGLPFPVRRLVIRGII